MFMMLTSRSLKVMVHIVGVLVVGWGMIAVFQVDDAVADNENEPPQHTHTVTVQTKVGYCGGPTIVFWYENGNLWWEYCTFLIYKKGYFETHGVYEPPSMSCKCTPHGPDYCPCSFCYEQNCNYKN